MKTIYFLIVSAVFCLCVTKSEAQIKNKKVKGTEYLIDTVMHKVANKANTINFKNAGSCQHYTFNQPVDISDVAKKVFSKEKIQSLAKDNKNNIHITLFCEIKTGKVLNVEFLLYKGLFLSEDETSLTSITLEELNKIEAFFKGTQYEIKANCPDVKYVNINYQCRFNRLVD
jgi:hypothetical protein